MNPLLKIAKQIDQGLQWIHILIQDRTGIPDIAILTLGKRILL